MGSNGSDEVMLSGIDEAECSETTVEIKIKTLDSQTYTLRVNKRVPVPELKEQIETVTGVLSDQQRLICRGKVLKDDQLLSAYHVEDGHTLHLVVRHPVPPSSTPTMGFMGSESLPEHPATDPAASSGLNRGSHIAHRVVLGSFNIADQGDGGIPDLNRIISAVLSSIGITNIGGSAEGADQMEPGSERLERTSGTTGMSDSNQPQLDQPTARVQFDPLHGAFRIPPTASMASMQPPVIPDSLTTLLQYLSHLRQEFSAIGGVQSNHPLDAGSNGERAQTTASHLDAVQVGLPTAASLAEVMLSTRQMLIEQAGGCLSQLARQLEDQASVTSPSLRNSIQTSAIRTGVSLQNLGALLLELGRTTMTLRMGQTPSEAVVNAGPAVFISPSGPNPIMVQPLPIAGFAATPMGSINPGSGLLGGTLGSGLFPRNIDIRIRTGHSTSTGNANQGEQAGAQQIPGQTGPARASDSAYSVHQEGAAVAGGPSFNGDSGARVVPIRTVVAAVPAPVSRPTSNSSGSSVGLLYPLLTRVHHVTPGQSNDARGSQASSEHQTSIPETDYQRLFESAMQQQNFGFTIEATNSETISIFPAHSASAVPGMSPANIVFQPHQQGASQIPIPSWQDPLDSNNNSQQSGGTQTGQDPAGQIPISVQLPSTIFPDEQIHVGNIEFQVQNTVPANIQEGTNAGADTAPRFGVDEGIFLSRVLRQIMPFISQTSAPEASDGSDGVDASENGNSPQAEEKPIDVGTSYHHNDPPTPPNSKRQKKE